MLIASSIVVTVWCCLLTATGAQPELYIPSFAGYENSFGIFLAPREPWRPSEATLFTAMMRDRPLRVENHFAKNFSNILKCSLIYKCQPDYKNLKEISVIGDSEMTNKSRQVLCQESTPFVVDLIPNTTCWFSITLVGASRVKFHQSFNHWLDLRVRFEFEIGGRIESESLFVFNFDSLVNINDAQSSIYGVEATRYILAEKGLQFLISDTDPQANTNDISTVQLLDKEFATLFRNAPLLIQAMTSVSVMIRVNKRCTEPLGLDAPDLLITTGDTRQAISNSHADETESVLDLRSGLLNYNSFALLTRRQVLMDRASKSSLPLFICTFVTVNYPIWDYQLKLTIVDNWKTSFTLPSASVSSWETKVTSPSASVTNLTSNFTATPSVRTPTWCFLPRFDDRKSIDSQSITLAEGLKDVFLINPILCNRGHTSITKAFVSDVECTGTELIWQPCYKLGLYIYVSRNATALWLRGEVTVEHSGKYQFVRDGLTFTFTVAVVSFPLFNTARNNNSLPLYTYAQLYNQVRFNCTAYHEGMQHVILDPRFHTIRLLTTKVNKSNFSRIEFVRKVLQASPNAIKIAYNATKQFTTLIVEMPRVTEYWKMWLLKFTCQASIIPDDAALMGVSHYSVSTSTYVKYSGYELKPNNPSSACLRCSLQRTICYLTLSVMTFISAVIFL